MRAAILVESLTGNTWKAGEMIAGHLQQAGWGITAVSRVRQPDHAALQAADMVVVGTWIHGLFVVGQAPWALGELAKLPAMKGKMAAAFCTYALNPGKSLQKMTGVLDYLGAEVLGGLALHRAKLPAHTEEFAARLVERSSEPV
jgi:flavodoxin